MGRLDSRAAIVTGGAKGIGRHYSFALAAEGARVMIADIADGAESPPRSPRSTAPTRSRAKSATSATRAR